MTKIVLRGSWQKRSVWHMKPSLHVCWDMNILPFGFLEKFPGSCWIRVNQSSKYCKKTFSSHENPGSSTLENGRSDGWRSNLWEFMSWYSLYQKTYSSKYKVLQFQQIRVLHILTKLYWQWNLIFVQLV